MRFEDALKLAGLQPRDIVPDGKWRRCGTEDHPRARNGAYCLAPDGQVGWFKNWAVDATTHQWRPDAHEAAQPISREELRRKRQEARDRQRRGIDRARQMWAAGKPYRGHKYLIDKGLDSRGCANLRTWTGPIRTPDGIVEDDWILVPMLWKGRLVNVQRIGTTGMKRQMKDCPQVGCIHTLGSGGAITVFAEGLATGLAVYQSVRHCAVHVVFYADNLKPVADLLQPRGNVVFAADNDWKTALKPHMNGVNPGIEKAKAAAELIGAGVAWPEKILGSDWADALCEWGPQAPRRIERLIVAAGRFIA